MISVALLLYPGLGLAQSFRLGYSIVFFCSWTLVRPQIGLGTGTEFQIGVFNSLLLQLNIGQTTEDRLGYCLVRAYSLTTLCHNEDD